MYTGPPTVALWRSQRDDGVLALIFSGVMGPVVGSKMNRLVNQFRVIMGPLDTEAPREPCSALVPDFNVMLTEPPPPWPTAASKLLASTRTSCTMSGGGTKAVVPPLPLLLTPSILKSAVVARPPATLMLEDWSTFHGPS